MKKRLTELVFILDKSGSMAGKEDDTIGSFNSTINDHKNNDYDVLVTTVLFSHNQEMIHDRINIKEVEPLNRQQYKANGSTALVDAIGDTITHIKTIHKYQRKQDVPEKTLFIIVTDGMENSSYKYSSDEVKKMVEQQKEKDWDFIFMGANIDAVETAKRFSIDERKTINFINDSVGIKKAHKFSSDLSQSIMKCKLGEELDDESISRIRKDVDEDYEKRRKRNLSTK